ncbi:MAG TPA: bifunctional 4-hydroxy-2-oxoglutarate aldolase/2-dehydro-3-deoxy-phosphogluconate aldolase [Terracidiphilus sp.]|nr:bifunctional 4-hydroxy-2-oxoglutarate aldolase/2-dehydro-3-deoxy-phosphogluconate aldolase [Terracidiphilus sp.]
MDSKKVRHRIEQIGIIPCARVKVAEYARFAAETLYAAEIPVLEVTMTLPQAPELIESLVKEFPDMIIGAGTVLDEESAHRCIAAGACFITSPGFIPEVVECSRKANVVVFPGALTATEVIRAWKAGADFVKIFPAAMVGGTHYVRALKVPLPQVPLIVTGGVNQLTAFDYILAGASAIGVGSELLPKEALVHRQADRIHELARRFLNMVKEARAQLESD